MDGARKRSAAGTVKHVDSLITSSSRLKHPRVEEDLVSSSEPPRNDSTPHMAERAPFPGGSAGPVSMALCGPVTALTARCDVINVFFREADGMMFLLSVVTSLCSTDGVGEHLLKDALLTLRDSYGRGPDRSARNLDATPRPLR